MIKLADPRLRLRTVVTAPAGAGTVKYNPAYSAGVVNSAALIWGAFSDISRLPDILNGSTMDPRATSAAAEQYTLSTIYESLSSAYPLFEVHVKSGANDIKGVLKEAIADYRAVASHWMGPLARNLCPEFGFRLFVWYVRNQPEAGLYVPTMEYCRKLKPLRELPFTVRLE